MASDVAAAFLAPDLVVVVGKSADRRHLDVARGELTGDPMTLADVVGYDIGFKLGAFSVSAAGSWPTRPISSNGTSCSELTEGEGVEGPDQRAGCQSPRKPQPFPR